MPHASARPRAIGARLGYQVTLQAADVSHRRGGDEQAEHSEAATHGRLASREGMLDRADGGFDGGSGVMTVLQQSPTTPTALRRMDFLLREEESEALIPFPWVSPALAGCLERAG